ncbi:Two-component transcriptional regulatory protein, LuxR family [Bosea sp. LC85]|uniref:response regulator transcription factor n=1 Tax=Bosea sp. LC85 TaxID=1502851 RepID=UPI0004E39729|nr:response regulator [Bosea sp. LC85]KFC75653.1 Two-component transcriptional regulatory protein, LuxR family [Bosea sp. LC85]
MKTAARTVYLVDDDSDVRDALTLLLKTMGFAAKPFSSAQAFLDRLDPRQDGCLVVDIRMPGVSGLQLLERMATEAGCMPTVVITGHGDVSACRRAFKAGAVDFLTKPVDEQVLLEAIEAGFAQFDDLGRDQAERTERAALLARLTPREREILDLVAQGRSTKEIARTLDLSPRTVETHRANIGEKLGATSVAAMVRAAL